MSTGKIIYIGLGQLGMNALFELKKRLARIRFAGGTFLISETNLAANPYQFLAIPEKPAGEDIEEQFRRASFTGSDRHLFQHEEICSLTTKEGKDNSDQVVASFKGAVARLNPFAHQNQFVNSTGIDILAYPPAAVFLFDLETIKKDEWRQLIDKIKNVRNQVRFRDAYHPHAVIFAHREESNREHLHEAGEIFHNIFLFDEESNLVLNQIDDQIDLAANLLQVLPQIGGANFMEYLQNANYKRYYSFGASHMDYPNREIIAEAVKRNLGDPAFQHADGLGKRFFNYFVENLREVDAREQPPFSLGKFEPEEKDRALFSDNHLPDIKPGVANRAHDLKENAKQWLEEKVARINEELKREAFISRIEDLTHMPSYKKICLEKWHDNFVALEFLLQKEILHSAEARAEKLKAQFVGMWEEYIENELYPEAKKTVYHRGDTERTKNEEVCDHCGQLLWLLTDKIIADVREILLPREAHKGEKEDQEAKDIPPAAPGRESVESYISTVPRPMSLLPRMALFIVLMIFFWEDIHFQLMTAAGSNILIPPWTTGIILGGLFAIAFYWFGYKKKVMKLFGMLEDYLEHCKNKKKRDIDKIQKNLATDFLVNAALYLRSRYAPRPNFFDYVIHQGNIRPEELVNRFSVKDHPLNPTELYYINRYWLYARLQDHLKEWTGRNHGGVLRKLIPREDSQDFQDRVAYLADAFGDYSRILRATSFIRAEESLPVWRKLLSKNNGEEENIIAKAEALIRVIISETGSIMEQFQYRDPHWQDLCSLLTAMNFQMDTALFTQMSNQSAPTFQIHRFPSMIHPVVYTAADQFFPAVHHDSISRSFDQNSIIFLCLEGPVTFKDIPWRQQNEYQ